MYLHKTYIFIYSLLFVTLNYFNQYFSNIQNPILSYPIVAASFF